VTVKELPVQKGNRLVFASVVKAPPKSWVLAPPSVVLQPVTVKPVLVKYPFAVAESGRFRVVPLVLSNT
jgi:hypothetical protein